MEKTRDLLMKDYNMVSDLLTITDVNSEGRTELMKERDNIRNELIKVDSTEIEADIKRAEIKAENKRELGKTIVTIGTFIVTTGVTIWSIIKTFKFDETGTITSTLGRGTLNGQIPKIKR